MTPLLALLIPYTPDRQPLFDRLVKELDRQRAGHDCIIISNLSKHSKDGGPTTGQKRNELLDAARNEGATHFSFADSDDMVGPTYVQRGIEFMNSEFDCAELLGQIYFSGKPGMPFHHYLSCTHAWEDKVKYHRPPNHLNFWRLDKVKDFKFQNKTFGEDMTWAMEIRNSGIIQTMMPIPEVIYHYYVGNPKHKI